MKTLKRDDPKEFQECVDAKNNELMFLSTAHSIAGKATRFHVDTTRVVRLQTCVRESMEIRIFQSTQSSPFLKVRVGKKDPKSGMSLKTIHTPSGELVGKLIVKQGSIYVYFLKIDERACPYFDLMFN